MKNVTRLGKIKFYLIIAVIVLTIFTALLSASYAFFSTRTESKEYIVYSGNLKVDFASNGGNVINMTGIPMLDIDGLSANNNEYSFKVVNNGSIDARYQVRLELDDTVSNVPIEYIRLSYKKNDGTYSEPVSLSDLNSNLVFTTDNILAVEGEDTIYLKLWVSINAGNDIQGKIFKARIVIDSIQNVEDGYEVDTKPIIVLNKDENNNIDQIIPLNSTYTELGVKEVKDDKDVLTPSDVTITGTVDTTIAGVYRVTYSVTDSNNETTTTTRTVAVGDEKTLNIKKNVPEVLAMYTSEQQSSNEAIVCSHIYGTTDLYLDCSIESTLDNAISKKNTSAIILTKNITKNAKTTVPAGKNLILDLNGKKLETVNPDDLEDTITTLDGAFNTINLNGNMIINDTLGGGSVIAPHSSRTIEVIETGNLVINGGTYNGRQAVVNRGNTIINDGTFNSKTTGAISADKNVTTINNGVFNKTVYNNGTGILNINGGVYNTGDSITIRNNSTGTLNIFGGTFSSDTNNTILNNSTGVINITQTAKPIYITTLAQVWKPAIVNNSTGIMNITANQANSCTSIASDTTSGLCVYAEGNKVYNTTDANGAVRNQSSGIINITGGTYYGGHQSINSVSTANISIKNAKLISDYICINNGTGVINVCDSIINGKVKEFHNGSTGIINYSSDVVFSNGTNTPDSGKVYNPSGTINSGYTCPATWTNS